MTVHCGRGRSPVIIQILCKQSPSMCQHSGKKYYSKDNILCITPVHIMPAHKLVKVHGNVLVVQLGPHDVVPVLQKTGKAEEHQERVAMAKLWGRGQAATK